MDITTYQTITGTTIQSSKQAFYTAMIGKAQRVLESMLGYTLNGDDIANNEYSETGKTTTELPLPSTTLTLTAPDAVVYAYRLYPFNSKDSYLVIDPCTAVHKVKLIKEDVTYKTFSEEEYRANLDRGIIKNIELMGDKLTYLYNYVYNYKNYYYNDRNITDLFQLAVDATWVWQEVNTPSDLLDVWAEMTTYYADEKRDIKSQTLGSHSYSKSTNDTPQDREYNRVIISKYAGPRGYIKRMPTI